MFSDNSLIDIDYTYKLVKELENLKSTKNAELRDQLYLSSPKQNSTFINFSTVNKFIQEPSYDRKRFSKERVYGNRMCKCLFITVTQIYIL